MKERTRSLLAHFYEIHPDLLPMKESLAQACEALLKTFQNGGKLLICGNGGSCADGDHIVGELMKGFLLKRPLGEDCKARLARLYGEQGAFLAETLQCGLPAVSLNAHTALLSAFSNDVDPELVYAQQVMGYAREGDAVLGISTSGNASNVAYALMIAKAVGASAFALTGRDGGKLARLADYCLIAPEEETYRIQEVHIALYHFLCAYIESEMFS